MKSLFKTIFSIFFALTMTSPAEALANPVLELNDLAEENEACSAAAGAEDYMIRFLRSDFGLSPGGQIITDQADSLVMFLTNPERKLIKDAQVVVTLVSQTGEQTMSRARPYKGGYFIRTDSLAPGHYRLEAEIITDGWLLTDQIYFEHA